LRRRGLARMEAAAGAEAQPRAGVDEEEEENGRLVHLTWNLRSHLTQVSKQLEVMQTQRTKLVSYTRFLEQQLADQKARAVAAEQEAAAARAAAAPSEAAPVEATKVQDTGVVDGGAAAAQAKRLALVLTLLFLAWLRQRKLNKGLAYGVMQARSEAEALQEANDDLRRMAEEHDECRRRQEVAMAAALAEEAEAAKEGKEEAAESAGGPPQPKTFADEDEEARFQDFAASMGFSASTPLAARPLKEVVDGGISGSDDDEPLEKGRSESAGELGLHRKRPRTTSAPVSDIAAAREELAAEEEEHSRPVIEDEEVLDSIVQLRKKLESFQTLLKFADHEPAQQTPSSGARSPLSQSGPLWTTSRSSSGESAPVNRQLAIGGRGLPRPEWEKHRRRCSRLFRALVDPVESGLVSPATAAGASSGGGRSSR